MNEALGTDRRKRNPLMRKRIGRKIEYYLLRVNITGKYLGTCERAASPSQAPRRKAEQDGEERASEPKFLIFEGL